MSNGYIYALQDSVYSMSNGYIYALQDSVYSECTHVTRVHCLIKNAGQKTTQE